MNKVVFLGNGINRCASESSYSWKKLLEDLKQETGKTEVVINDSKPFPLLYEEIYLSAMRSAEMDEMFLLDSVRKKVEKLEKNNLHELLPDLNIKTYITTNYDYLIEKSLSPQTHQTVASFGVEREYKYRIRTKNVSAGKDVWHIHGESNYPNTMVLGLKMYSDAIHRISRYLENEMKNKSHQSWINCFFEDEVIMIGYGLSYQDITVWYVLTERARMIAEGKIKANQVTFYLAIKDETASFVSEFKMLLETYYINVMVSEKTEEYQHFYERILRNIAVKIK